MRILTVLTFYEPHWTGLTAIAKRVAEGLAARGHDVTVLTTQHLPELPRREVLNGVDVVRLAPVGRLSRGLIAPAFPHTAYRLIGSHDVVQIHTPLLEGALVGAMCRARRRPLVMTHQGDLVMPGGLVDQGIQKVGTALLTASGRLATVVCPLNADYAENSVFLQRFSGKLVPILPPVDIPAANVEAAARWREELGLDERRVVGIVGRFVEEKGFDYLFGALPELLEDDPDVRVVYAGEHDMVYEDFYARCRPLIEPLAEFVTFTGLIRDRQRLADFYAMCDVLVLPSRTDSFAAVQVEAMLSGTPVVAADIPGARVPVRLTGMGLLVEPRNPRALATGIRQVLRDPTQYTRPREEIRDVFDPVESVDRYEALMTRLSRPRA